MHRPHKSTFSCHYWICWRIICHDDISYVSIYMLHINVYMVLCTTLILTHHIHRAGDVNMLISGNASRHQNKRYFFRLLLICSSMTAKNGDIIMHLPSQIIFRDVKHVDKTRIYCKCFLYVLFLSTWCPYTMNIILNYFKI